MKNFIVFTALTVLVACIPKPQDNTGGQADTIDMSSVYSFCPRASDTPLPVSLDALVSDPSAFEGRTVETEGYFHSSFEHHAIYPAPKSNGQEFSTGLWVVAPIDTPSGELVRLTGTITVRSKGHLGQWPGTLCVTRIASVVAA